MATTVLGIRDCTYRFADKPAIMMLFLLLSVAITFGTIVIAALHEKHAYNNH